MARSDLCEHVLRYEPMSTNDPMIGREILSEVEASPNYRLRQVRRRRTDEVSWEVVETASAQTVVAGLATQDEALRIIKAWERLSQKRDGGLPGHVLVH